MAIEHWTTRPDQNIELNPIGGWEVATFPMTIAARLSYFRSEEEMRDDVRHSLQLAMTASQARELGQLLLRTADAVDAQPLGTRQ